MNISRSTLERRFARALGRSAKAEIDRVRLEQVKQLLAMTDYPLARIAQLTGFAYMEGMCCLFKNTFGQTPGQYRRHSVNEVSPRKSDGCRSSRTGRRRCPQPRDASAPGRD